MFMTALRLAGVVCLATILMGQVPAQTYTLVVGRSGTRIPDSPPESKKTLSRGNGKLVGRRVTMPELARLLSDITGRTVVDETGLPGEYDVKLAWSPDTGPKSEKERADLNAAVETRSIFSAVREQLGLDLVPRKVGLKSPGRMTQQ